MEKLYSTLFILMLNISLCCAQGINFFGIQDCCTAGVLEGPENLDVFSGIGAGDIADPIQDCSCADSPESSVFWFVFDCISTSDLEFIVKPKAPGSDYDFVVWQGGCPCSGTGVPVIEVGCDNTNDPGGFTGMGNPAQWGLPGSPGFAPAFTMQEGATYYLMLNNTTGTEGFELTWGPNVDIGQLPNPGPPVSGPTSLCTGAEGQFLTGGNPMFEIEWTINNVTIPTLSSTPVIDLDFPNAGTFEICAQITIECQTPFDPSCVTVVVADIPVTEINDKICIPPGIYNAPDGTEVSAPGVYEYTFQSFLGCDSLVRLTLEPAYGDYIVRSATVCEGDCIEFEGETLCESNLYETTYSNVEGCDSTIVMNLVVVPLDTKVEIEDTLTCIKTSVILDGSMSIGGADMAYIWTNSAGDTIDTDSVTIVNAPGFYTLTTTSFITGDTCVDFNTVQVIEDTATPEGVTAVGDTLSCLASTGMLMGNSTTPNVTYEWTGPNGFSSFEQNPAVQDTGTYTLMVTGENGCVEFASTKVIEIPEAIAVSATGGTIDCINSSVVLDANSPEPNLTYVWTGPSGTTYNGKNPSVSEAGVYSLIVTDVNGCTGTAETEVLEDINLPIANATNIVIFNCDANTVLLNGAGSSFGTNFSYLWTTTNGNIVSDETTLTPTVSSVGVYTLTVTNNTNGCTATAMTSVQEYPQLFAVITSRESVSCFGADDGSASALGVGGNGMYTYQWSNGQNSPDATGLSGGVYTVTITSAGNCSAMVSVLITQPSAPLEANATATPETNAGANDGTATASPSGGTPGYTYEWSNGETTSTITDLPPGNYTVTVTDANDCESIQTVTVNQPDCFISASIIKEDVSCNGAADGTAEVNLDNAMEPYTYEWSNGGTTQQVTGLAPGTYSVTATDANGCEVAVSVTIVQPLVLNANAMSTDITIPNANDGTASASPTGGTGPYTYEWSNGGNTASINNLAPGEYTVTVTDNNDCTSTQTVIVEGFGCIMTLEVASTDVTCFGGSNGQATVIPSNGLAPFTYEWSNGETTATIGDLPAGIYDILVTDSTDCPAMAQVTISEPDELIIDVTELVDTDCGDTNGTATVTPQGGTPGYSYEWSNGQMDSTAIGLAAGVYTVVTTDNNGCTTEVEVEIETDITSDNIPPVAAAGNITIELDANGQASIVPGDVDNGSSDNCGITAMELDLTSFDCSNIGDNTVTLTITDVGGNTDMATATVTVEDNAAPTATCPANMIVPYCDPIAMFTVEGDDNCPGDITITQTSGLPSGSQFPEGEVTMQMFDVSDAAGNTTTCSFTVEVSEVIVLNPTATDASCSGENDGTATANISGGIPDYTYEWSNDSTGVTITNLGPGTYTVIVTDQGGCTETGTVEVGLDDTTPPTIECPGNIVVPYCDPIAEFQVTGDDNCPGDLTINQTSGLPSGSEFPEGEVTTQTFEATDASGNAVTCTFTVEVSDVMEVDPIGDNVSCFGEADGSANANVDGGIPGYSYSWSNDSTSVSITELGPGTYTVTVTDQGGCQEVGEVEIIQPTQLVTQLVDIINEVNGNSNGSVDVTVSGGTGTYTYQWTDLNGNVLGDMEDISGLPAGTYQLFATDENGCISSSAYTIQNISGTFDPTLFSKILLYPNPSSGLITIELLNVPVSEMEVAVYDVLGKVAYRDVSAQVNSGKHVLDLTSFPEGMYLVKMNIDGQEVTKRIVRGL